ncbi:MAG: MBL fold metallo-hydrolase [Candidatus Aenigmatarchaeota archaeon]|nr:MAG: MBL fold metallo-hydrolase [Candidatus Aenigmarchaeota archaeon]
MEEDDLGVPVTAKIKFLGTAGGRFAVINQIRASGGWVLEMDGYMLHVDPGPGALVRAKQYGVDISKLDGVMVSHAHPDHSIDSEMVIEGMTMGAKVKRGFLLSNKTVFDGSDGFRPVVSPYHKKAVKDIFVVKPGDVVDVGGISIEAVPTDHSEPDGLGFVFRGSSTIGFTGDGEYFDSQPGHFKGCDCLLINCLRPRSITWPKHMNSDDARKLIAEANPGMAVLHHFGIRMINRAGHEAKWIEKETGIKTIAARDGLSVDVGKP